MNQEDALKKLREPFPANQISQLPKGGIKLDYVGHAALTARLLDVDPLWSWEPYATDERGLPVLDEHGGLWIKLTVAGMTRLGYGDAGDKKGANAMKERIGDALRNAAMRFGAALDLWHKGELYTNGTIEGEVTPTQVRSARVAERPVPMPVYVPPSQTTEEFPEDLPAFNSMGDPITPLDPKLVQTIAITLSGLGFKDKTEADRLYKLAFVEFVLSADTGTITSTKMLTEEQARFFINALYEQSAKDEYMKEWATLTGPTNTGTLGTGQLPDELPLPTASKFPPSEKRWALIQKLAKEKGIDKAGIWAKVEEFGNKYVKTWDDIGGKEAGGLIDWLLGKK